MKKSLKFLMAAVVVLLAVNANAQFGIKAGYVSTQLREKYDGKVYRERPMDGFKFGVDYDVQFGTSGFSFRPGLNYIYIGDSNKYGDNKELSRYHFLNVPLDFKFDLPVDCDVSIYAFVGPKLVVGLGGKMIEEGTGYKYTYHQFTGKYSDKDDGEDDVNGNGPALLNRFDLQIGAGLGVQFYGFSVEFGYDWGMLNLAKYDRKDYMMKRNQITATVGYSF